MGSPRTIIGDAMAVTNYTTNANAVDPLHYVNQGGVPARSEGDYKSSLADTLFSGTSSTSAWVTSGYLGIPRETTLFISTVGGSNTVTVEVSVDGTNWYFATVEQTGVQASLSLTDAVSATAPTTGGTAVLRIEPTPYYRVKFSAAETVAVQHILKY
jgi:hypothetical protein